MIHRDRLIAIDLGFRTGVAVFSADGQLEWARSHHFGGISQNGDASLFNVWLRCQHEGRR